MVTRRRRPAEAERTIRNGRATQPPRSGAGRGAGRIRRFRERAEAVGAEVVIAAGPTQARGMIAGIIRETGAATVASAGDAKGYLTAALNAGLVRGPKAEDIAAAGAGVVLAHYGIAETGSLVHLDRSDADKNAWTLPPVCLAVLEAKTIAERLEDVLPALRRHLADAGGFGQASIVTGPSRTADVENVLQTGVHGPGRLIIVLIEGKAVRRR
ncbi:MAG: LUD domain-containing protein [Candidatus Aminicenantes bacterium]|nr:LUD domain-containing protein [Candidatus Aminicenantes bacterium]